MKKYILTFIFAASSILTLLAQYPSGSANPFINAVDLTPDNSPGLANGVYSCGDPVSVSFNMGQSTNNFALPDVNFFPLQAPNLIEIDLCIVGWEFNSVSTVGSANGIVSGTYASKFDWTFNGSTCIKGTQTQIIPVGPVAGSIVVALKVPIINTCSSCLNVTSSLFVPNYVNQSNTQTSDDVVSTNASVWCRVLPIQKLEINSILNENKINKLSWKTLNEQNTLAFEIERKYSNEETWMTIGKTPAAGQSSKELTYAYSDATYAQRDKIYYRIKQVDVDGTYSYTDIKGIELKKNSQVKLDGYPNPVKDLYHLTITGAKDDKVSIDVYDILGRSVSRKTLSIVKGSNYHDLNMGTYTPGTYIVRVSSAEINESMTVVKVD